MSNITMNETKEEVVKNYLKTDLNTAEENDEIIFNKYFNAPYTSTGKNSEKINLNTGSLEFKSTDLSLKGRNGLDLNITMRYDSS
ncbi:MAG TPA: hypothetical protein DDW34_14165, partial [Clostridium sp.]|nr:hypothetical protein [Clostridium sp.]